MIKSEQIKLIQNYSFTNIQTTTYTKSIPKLVSQLWRLRGLLTSCQQTTGWNNLFSMKQHALCSWERSRRTEIPLRLTLRNLTLVQHTPMGEHPRREISISQRIRMRDHHGTSSKQEAHQISKMIDFGTTGVLIRLQKN